MDTSNLDTYRQVGDSLADEAIQVAMADPKRLFYQVLAQGPGPLADWTWQNAPDLAKSVLASDNPSRLLVRQTALAQGVFKRRAAVVMILLGHYSLPYCYAAAKGAKVLAATQRLHAHAFSRLAETGGFVWQVMAGTESEARGACLQVRLIHALVRHKLMAGGNWDTLENGVPINQEDMAGTNLAFGYLTIRGLRKLNLGLSSEEAEAYLAYWNRLGGWLGVEAALLPAGLPEALQLEQAIAARQMASSPEGHRLAEALLDSIAETEAPSWLRQNAPALMRYLLGHTVADMIGLPMGDTDAVSAAVKALAFAPDAVLSGSGGIRREARRWQVKG